MYDMSREKLLVLREYLEEMIVAEVQIWHDTSRWLQPWTLAHHLLYHTREHWRWSQRQWF
jgi:hypothetical protein